MMCRRFRAGRVVCPGVRSKTVTCSIMYPSSCVVREVVRGGLLRRVGCSGVPGLGCVSRGCVSLTGKFSPSGGCSMPCL